jgi:hypothetical protein
MEKPAAQGSAATTAQKKELAKKLPFKEMNGTQKTVFIAKLVISIVSFGFIFPD